ncbi:MAG: hypothetical protein HYV75_04255 [Opitutae bacterium]|nr:hypothetical protein [Opitutae bacterium]
MFTKISKLLTLTGLLFGASLAFAQDSKALIDVLIQKGILNQDEAAKIQKDLAKSESASDVATSKGKFLQKLTISGRFHIQYAGLSTDIDGTAADPVSTNHFFMRRMYLGAKAELGEGWSGNLNYDFAGSTFDAAFVQWKHSGLFVLDAGFRKVPFGLEEWYTSSSNLRAIERSPGTRYFVEGNNGRRLGAGSYRTGLFLGGKDASGLFYNVALTNPERDESAAGVTSGGNAARNSMAYWGNVGYSGKMEGGTFVVSGSVGFLPDQGQQRQGCLGHPGFVQQRLVHPARLQGRQHRIRGPLLLCRFRRARPDHRRSYPFVALRRHDGQAQRAVCRFQLLLPRQRHEVAARLHRR